MRFVFKSTGQYLGFIQNGLLFSRDGIYLGWLEGNYVWGSDGQFRGTLSIDGKYVLRNLFTIQPLPKPRRAFPAIPALPPPPPNIPAIVLPVGYIDAF